MQRDQFIATRLYCALSQPSPLPLPAERRVECGRPALRVALRAGGCMRYESVCSRSLLQGKAIERFSLRTQLLFAVHLCILVHSCTLGRCADVRQKRSLSALGVQYVQSLCTT